jgi:hypothetical protein
MLLSVLAAAPAASPKTTPPTAQEIVSRWRAAVHARDWTSPQTAAVAGTSDEDGITSKEREWLSTAGDYRGVTTRDFDDAEIVLTASTNVRRDWNGFLRAVDGNERSRARTTVLEESVLVFGPPQSLEQATLSTSDDGKLYVLKAPAPGGKPIVWSIDSATWLPLNSSRAGDDSEVTTTNPNGANSAECSRRRAGTSPKRTSPASSGSA